jgi:signal transduction histidine kinase
VPINWQPLETPYACLEIKDTGCGMADHEIEQIFDPFYSTKFPGRGMGLAVVLGITRTLDGVITVESKPGAGSVFRVYLPVAN